MIDPHYQSMYKQASILQNHFHDYTLATAHTGSATVLRNEIHNLTNDIASHKNPRTIDDRLRTIQTQLRNEGMMHPGTDPTMGMHVPGMPAGMPGQYGPSLNYNQRNLMNHGFDQLRQGLRQHPKW
ncbi:MAG TPA: hypothetical protein VL737_00920 [Candidatus Pristimantibacillus sp.]|jgi:hypothetical protein|nr:hypothetical protein [Candidatus Pristimantibacillus sp.]